MPLRDAANMQESFERAYERRYLRKIENVAAEVAAWRLTMLGPAPGGMNVAPLLDDSDFEKGARKIYSGPEGGFEEARVYHRYSLPAGREFSGPAIVEERESTIVVPEDARFRKDAGGHIIIEVKG